MNLTHRHSRFREWIEDAASILNPFPPMEEEEADDLQEATLSPAQVMAADWAMLGWDLRRTLNRVGRRRTVH